MITIIIISTILIVFVIGFIQVYNRHSEILKKVNFSNEYREKFIKLANKYFRNYDKWTSNGDVDNKLYVWLTMNVSKIQNHVGHFGVMSYKPAFQNYMINNYQIIINTLPKFREQTVENSEVGSVDDCLLRYIGYLDEYQKETRSDLRNPIIWFREGFREILSIPIFILSWFGIISNQTLNSIKNSLIYKVISGLFALTTLLSGIVTIIVGYDESLKFVNNILGNN